MQMPMKRLLTTLPVALAILLVLAPAALAHDGGEGWWGETDDKVVTNAGFIIIVGVPILVTVMSLAYNRLEDRRLRRLAASKARTARADQRGGW